MSDLSSSDIYLDVSDLSVIPLTAIFKPPSSCQSAWTYGEYTAHSDHTGFLVQNIDPSLLDKDCFPPGFTNDGTGDKYPPYSPGYCPDGYSAPFQSVTQGVTVNTWCYSSYSFIIPIDYVPYSTISLACVQDFPAGSTTTVPASLSEDNVSTTTISGPLTMWAQPIQVAFEASDLSLYLTTTSGSPTQTASTSPAHVPSPTQTASPSPAHVPSLTQTGSVSGNSPSAGSRSSGLSTGAKVGIGVGVVLGLLVLISFIVGWFLKRSRRRRQDAGANYLDHSASTRTTKVEENVSPGTAPGDTKERSEIHGVEHPPPELHSSHRVEMPTTRDGEHFTAELP